MSVLKMLKDIGFLYQKIVKIVNLGEYSFYDKATLIDDYLHYSRFCKETIDNKVFMYRCGNSKCNFTVIVDYKNKLIELSRLECT